MKTLILFVVLAGLLQSCSDGKATPTPMAVEIFNTPGGVRCFAIQQDGQTVGGNCIPQ